MFDDTIKALAMSLTAHCYRTVTDAVVAAVCAAKCEMQRARHTRRTGCSFPISIRSDCERSTSGKTNCMQLHNASQPQPTAFVCLRKIFDCCKEELSEWDITAVAGFPTSTERECNYYCVRSVIKQRRVMRVRTSCAPRLPIHFQGIDQSACNNPNDELGYI